MPNWTDKDIQAVWERGRTVQGADSAKWRQDACTAWISRDKYGDRESDYGWEIDHIDPNGGDSITNLRPLQWRNNLAKSDNKLQCAIQSDGNKNVPVKKEKLSL